MQIKVFYIPVADNEQEIKEMNSLLRGKKIIDVEKEFVSEGKKSFYSFCVKYIENSTKTVVSSKKDREKIDYKEILPPDIFAVFSKLRESRKLLSDKKGVPVYAVFNNKELAKIAELKDITIENIKKTDGIGSSKIEKYAVEMLEYYKKSTDEKTNLFD